MEEMKVSVLQKELVSLLFLVGSLSLFPKKPPHKIIF